MMDNQQTKREDVYEAYVDASVALLMQQYCDALDEGIANSDNISAKGEAAVFPEDLDAWCRSLIKKTIKRKKFHQAMRNAGKALRAVCCAVVVCLAMISFLFVTVEAVRVPLINLWIEYSPNNFIAIKGVRDGEEIVMDESFDPTDPLHNIIPGHYQITMQEGTTLTNFTAIYTDSNDNTVYFKSRPIESLCGIDTEDADSIQEFHIFNCDAILVTEGDTTRMMITDEEHAAIFTLIMNGDPDLDAIDIANDFLQIIS